jgi:ABC-type glycerol-3-phosphate transport system substrate-binding protein
MIDDSFTPESGIKVNVKLVDPNALLSAVVAGNGPDVVLSVGSTLPVDYALRNAVVDLSKFEGFDQTAHHFYPSALTPFRYNGGVYAHPETQTFSVLFYRKDILGQLALEVPKTWEDLIGILTSLQGNNLSAGLPYPSILYPNLSAFNSMAFQSGARLYTEDGMKTAIDSEAGIRAFKQFTNFFTSYGLPKDFDFVSRFRSGEMPIGVIDYASYNTLVVSAPEIRGLWDFTILPGTVRTGENGEPFIDHSVATSGTCSMIIRTGDENIKANCWKFLRWWVSTEAQVRFGREIESLLGASARYATANREALRQLSWSSAQLQVLEESLASSVGVPEVPGGYYTPRHLTNAIRKVINDRDDPRETLIDYARKINEELTKKRREFALPVR